MQQELRELVRHGLAWWSSIPDRPKAGRQPLVLVIEVRVLVREPVLVRHLPGGLPRAAG